MEILIDKDRLVLRRVAGFVKRATFMRSKLTLSLWWEAHGNCKLSPLQHCSSINSFCPLILSMSASCHIATFCGIRKTRATRYVITISKSGHFMCEPRYSVGDKKRYSNLEAIRFQISKTSLLKKENEK